MFTIDGKYTTAKVMIDNVEESAVAQIVKMVNHSAFTNPVSIMPDTHAGAGCVIGFTMPISDSICPAVVGVDIGCGVLSYPLGVVYTDLAEIDRLIRKSIPFGFKVRDSRLHRISDSTVYGIYGIRETCKKIGADLDRVLASMGTLGGGNHFIEIGRSPNTGEKWITIHTGSRNFGKRVCDYHQKRAVNLLQDKYKGEYQEAVQKMLLSTDPKYRNEKKKEIKAQFDIPVNTKGLESLSGSCKEEYLYDMRIAQEFASLNRRVILSDILFILGVPYDPNLIIESVHNFIDMEDNIIRKGAIRAYEGEKLVIPWSMSEGLIIGEGKSNPDWNFSAPHGAGRTMSRTQAKKVLNKEEEKKKMEGIYISVLPIDEAPGAYKDSSLVESLIEPTVRILDKIKPIHNMKSH